MLICVAFFCRYLLGIQDEYNICRSRGEGDEMMQEFYSWVPVLGKHARSSSIELFHSTLSGFALYTGTTELPLQSLYVPSVLIACFTGPSTGIGKRILSSLLITRNRDWVDPTWAKDLQSQESMQSSAGRKQVKNRISVSRRRGAECVVC